MDVHVKTVDSDEVSSLKQAIETLVSEVQEIRMSHDLSKLTQVRLIDLQYSAKLVIDNLNNNDSLEEENAASTP